MHPYKVHRFRAACEISDRSQHEAPPERACNCNQHAQRPVERIVRRSGITVGIVQESGRGVPVSDLASNKAKVLRGIGENGAGAGARPSKRSKSERKKFGRSPIGSCDLHRSPAFLAW